MWLARCQGIVRSNKRTQKLPVAILFRNDAILHLVKDQFHNCLLIVVLCLIQPELPNMSSLLLVTIAGLSTEA